MAESQKVDSDILVDNPCPLHSSPILFVQTKDGALSSASLCYGCTVIHAMHGKTTLYHLSDRSACSGYMSGIAKRSVEGGYDIQWGYCSALGSYSISDTYRNGGISLSVRRPRVFDQYHEGGDTERFVFPGTTAPRNHAPIGDNLMSLLGIEDGDSAPVSPPTPTQTRPSQESVSEAKETPVAPHRRVITSSSEIRSYLADLRS